MRRPRSRFLQSEGQNVPQRDGTDCAQSLAHAERAASQRVDTGSEEMPARQQRRTLVCSRSLKARAFLGKTVANRFRLEKLIGEGSAGLVYLATDTLVDEEQVAVKILSPRLMSDPLCRAAFLQEVKLTRRISDNNVVRTFDIGIWKSLMYFSMEYVPGPTLGHLIPTGKLDLPVAMFLLRQICRGLQAIHAIDVVHGDIKPDNIFLAKGGKVKIGDFGVARFLHTDPQTPDTLKGSIPFMAPELWLGESVGAATDLYALGVTAYELFTGVQPVGGATAHEVMTGHLTSRVIDPRRYNRRIPVWLARLVLTLLQKDPNSRPASVDKVLEFLDHQKNFAMTQQILASKGTADREVLALRQ